MEPSEWSVEYYALPSGVAPFSEWRAGIALRLPTFLVLCVFGTTTRAGRKNMKKKADYKKDLLDDLRKDKEYAALYLSAALKDSPEAFLVALRDVAEAGKGVARIAQIAGVNRENLYRMFSEKGNPRLTTLIPVLHALGLQMVVETHAPPARIR